MGLLYELRFTAKTDDMDQLDFNESLAIPGVYMTIISGISLQWRLFIYPLGLEYTSQETSDRLHVTADLLSPSQLRKADFRLQSQSQIWFSDERVPNFDARDFHSHDVTDGFSIIPSHIRTLEPRRTIEGRVLIILEPPSVSVAGLMSEKRAAAAVAGNSVGRKLFDAVVAGDTALCDTTIICSDGNLRAASPVLRVLSDYFARLFEFNASAGNAPLTVDLSKQFPVAAVSAVLRFLHTFALPPLGEFDLGALEQILELAALVNLDGMDLLKVTVEESLLGRDLSDAPTLGALASLGHLHELTILSNVTEVCLANKLLKFYELLRNDVSEDIWVKVDGLNQHALKGIFFHASQYERDDYILL